MTALERGEGQIGYELSRAQQRAGALIQEILSPEEKKASPFSLRLATAINNPLFHDHNINHTTGVAKGTHFVVSGLGEKRRAQIKPHLDAVMLFADFHDSAQIVALQRNSDEGRSDQGNGSSKKLNAKLGHGLEAAGMILALTPTYARVNAIPLEEARAICGQAAFMFIRHEDVYSFDQAIHGTELPSSGQEGELIRLFNNSTLDLSAISPKDVLTLLRHEKNKGGLEGFGFDPLFHQQYAQELQSLVHDNKPLFDAAGNQKKESLCAAAHVALAPDIIAMVAPAEQATARLLETQYSRNRPFFIGQKDQLLELIHRGDGNGFGESAPYDCDVYRILWQLVHQEHLLLGNPIFSEHGAMQNYLKVNALKGVSLLRRVGTGFMGGNVSVISEIKSNQGAPIFDQTKITDNLVHKPPVKGVKRDIHSTGVRIYPSGDIDTFTQVCDTVYDELKNGYGIQEVNLGAPIRRQGLTSTIFTIKDQPGFVAKMYHRERLWDTVPLDDPLKRAELTHAELRNLGILAQSLNATLALARDGYEHEGVIKLKKLHPEDFLADKIKKGEVRGDDVRAIAAKLVEYQFTPGLCPPVDFDQHETMETFLHTLLLGGKGTLGEMGILEHNKFIDTAKSKKWRASIGEFMGRNAPFIQDRSLRFGEPTMGHGDIKLDNIAIDKNGVVSIIDIAPHDPWRINDRRMDALFLWAELMVNGKEDLAQEYWNEYNDLYSKRIQLDTLQGEDRYNAQKGIEVIDALSKVYRYMIFYRMASKSNEESRAERSLDLLQDSIQNMGQI